MSIKVLSWVWDNSKSSGNDKLVLLKIADNAWDDGTHAWPSINHIVEKTGLGERTVQRCIQRLMAMGELEVDSRSGRSNLYRVIMEQEQKPKAIKQVRAKTAEIAVRSKPKDELWEELMLVCGVNTETINSQERGRHNKAVKALRESGATVEQIQIRAGLYTRKFPNTVMTPIALASHWSELDPSNVDIVSTGVVPAGWDAIRIAREQRGTTANA